MIAHKGSSLLSTPFLCVLSIYCPKSHLFYTEEEGSGENSWTQDVVFVFKDSNGKIEGKKLLFCKKLEKISICRQSINRRSQQIHSVVNLPLRL